MSTFYVVPSRPVLGARLAAVVQKLLPGVSLPVARWADLADGLIAAALEGEDAYVVYGEDLPDGVPVDRVLVAAFGAGDGDEFVEGACGTRRLVQAVESNECCVDASRQAARLMPAPIDRESTSMRTPGRCRG